MSYAKQFLGEKNTTIRDELYFTKQFEGGMNKSLCVIKTKMPVPKQETHSVHVHNHFEFTIPRSHSPKLLIEDKLFMLPCNNIFPSNPGQKHGLAETAHQHHLIAFQLDFHFLHGTAFSVFGKNNIIFLNTHAPFDIHLENMLELFLYECQNKQAGYEFILDNLSSMITIHLLRTLKSNFTPQENQSCWSMKQEISRAVEFLYANYDNDFSIDEVSAAAGLSKYYFIRLFKQETGKTPYQFFLDIKMKKAIEFVRTRKYSITEVCFMCGFKSHSHFSRLFYQKVGMTPSQFYRAL